MLRATADGDLQVRGFGIIVPRRHGREIGRRSQIIEAHNGRIWCEPAAGDQGTRFILRLPIQFPGERGREEASTSGTTWP